MLSRAGRCFALTVTLFGVGCAAGPNRARSPELAGRDGAVVRVYDVNDLLVIPPDFVFPDRHRPTGGAAPAVAPNSLRHDARDAPDRRWWVEEIVRLVTESVASDSWRESGGEVGTITAFRGQLVVTQTPANHREIANLLSQVRDMQGFQVKLGGAIVAEDEATLNEVVASAAQVPPTSKPPALPELPGPPMARAPTYGAVLNDEAAARVLRTATSGAGSAVVAAPRLTLLNQTWASVLAADQRLQGGAVAESGMLLAVYPVVSADWRWVTLSLYAKRLAPTPPNEARPEQPEASEVKAQVAVPDGGWLVLFGSEDVTAPAPGAAPQAIGTTQPARPRKLILLVRATILPRASQEP